MGDKLDDPFSPAHPVIKLNRKPKMKTINTV